MVEMAQCPHTGQIGPDGFAPSVRELARACHPFGTREETQK